MRRRLKSDHFNVWPFARVRSGSVVYAAPVLLARIVLDPFVVARRRILEQVR